MDYSPRMVIEMVREGFRDDVLASRTVWLCSSCYSCDVECPARIHLTDVMGNLQSEALRRRIYPRRIPVPVLERVICQAVYYRGCSPEFWHVLGVALRSNPRGLLTMLRTGWRLRREGRLPWRREKPKKPPNREGSGLALSSHGTQGL
jgi:heterodisulfide reductase subunit C